MSTLKDKASSVKSKIKSNLLKVTLAMGLGAGGCATNPRTEYSPDNGDYISPDSYGGDYVGGYDGGSGVYENGGWANRGDHNREHGPQHRPQSGGNHGGHGGGGHGGGHGGGGHGGGHKR